MHRHLTIALLAMLVTAAPANAAVTATTPSLVTGTDGRRHLVYELIVDSGTRMNRLDVVAGNETIATYRGVALEAITFDQLVMLDIPLRPGARVPVHLEHRLSGRRTARVRVDRRAPIRISPRCAGRTSASSAAAARRSRIAWRRSSAAAARSSRSATRSTSCASTTRSTRTPATRRATRAT